MCYENNDLSHYLIFNLLHSTSHNYFLLVQQPSHSDNCKGIKIKNNTLRQHAKLVKHNNYVENETSGQNRFSRKIRGISIRSCF